MSPQSNFSVLVLRLTITLRFLATGDSWEPLETTFGVSKSSITKIVPETCRAIILSLVDYIKVQVPLD